MKSLHMALAAGAVAAAAVLAFVLNWKPKLAVAPLTSDEVRKHVQGKSFLIVGGTKGIGAALGRALVENDARVTVTGRKRVKGETPDGAEFIESDLSTVRASRNLVRNLLKDRRFDTVVLTVGIITRPELTRTADGIEEDLAISYLSRFIITNELIRANMLEGRKRIFIMGYPGQKLEPINLDDINFKTTPYSQWGAHMNTVIFNEALQLELAEKHPNLRIFGLNPGLIQTGIRDNFHGGKSSFLGRVLESAIALTNVSPDQYARDVLLPLMASPELESKTSLSFSQKGEQLDTPVLLQSKSIRQKIWNESQLLVNQADPENAVVY